MIWESCDIFLKPIQKNRTSDGLSEQKHFLRGD